MSSKFLASLWKKFRGRGILDHTPVLCGTVSWVKISWYASEPRKPRKFYPPKNTRYTVPQWGRPFCLDVHYTCNVLYTNVRLHVTHTLSYGEKGHLCVREKRLAWILHSMYIYEAIACAHAYVLKLYNMQDKAGH